LPETEYLMAYIDTFDARLRDYVDEDDDLSAAAIEKLLSHTSDLLAGTITAPGLAELWPEWFDLVSLFVVSHGSPELEGLEVESRFGCKTEWEDGEPPSGLTRAYLLVLELELDMCPKRTSAAP
jgi:hypothetical protein